MAAQASANNDVRQFILSGDPKFQEAEVILTEATRTVPLLSRTLMSKDPATRKWTPYTNTKLTATDGTQWPMGIYIGDDIPAASLTGADLAGCPILVGGDILIDGSLLVFGKGPTGALATITKDSVAVLATALLTMTIEDALAMKGIIIDHTIAIDAVEN